LPGRQNRHDGRRILGDDRLGGLAADVFPSREDFLQNLAQGVKIVAGHPAVEGEFPGVEERLGIKDLDYFPGVFHFRGIGDADDIARLGPAAEGGQGPFPQSGPIAQRGGHGIVEMLFRRNGEGDLHEHGRYLLPDLVELITPLSYQFCDSMSKAEMRRRRRSTHPRR